MVATHAKQPGEPTSADCPMRAAMSALGGRWSLILLYWLDGAPRRFNELLKLVPDISPKVLTDVLRALEGEGLIDHTSNTMHAVYAITAHGRSARPLIDAIHDWGEAHLARPR